MPGCPRPQSGAPLYAQRGGIPLGRQTCKYQANALKTSQVHRLCGSPWVESQIIAASTARRHTIRRVVKQWGQIRNRSKNGKWRHGGWKSAAKKVAFLQVLRWRGNSTYAITCDTQEFATLRGRGRPHATPSQCAVLPRSEQTWKL